MQENFAIWLNAKQNSEHPYIPLVNTSTLDVNFHNLQIFYWVWCSHIYHPILLFLDVSWYSVRKPQETVFC